MGGVWWGPSSVQAARRDVSSCGWGVAWLCHVAACVGWCGVWYWVAEWVFQYAGGWSARWVLPRCVANCPWPWGLYLPSVGRFLEEDRRHIEERGEGTQGGAR